ncbi:MAG: hypothetical protein JXR77_14015 [Lentisphaeria bacterium]|nr:hypothetical protein [Lentisphaeria bacterium]
MNEVKIGWACRDVSTDAPIDIPGQFNIRVSRGVLDPLTVTALVIENGSDMVVFLSADFVSIRPYLLQEIRDKVEALVPGFPVGKILMNCTHTHEGASYYRSTSTMATPAEVPHEGIEIASSDEYRAFLSTEAAAAVAEAFAARSRGGVAYGYGYAVVGHSRRVVYFDDLSERPGAAGRPGMIVAGHAAMYGNTADDQFSHYEAGADHFINLLYTFDEDGRLTGAIANVPCPSQNSESEWRLSADYWHDVRVLLRQKYGSIFLLPQCAAAGDLAPRILHYKEAQERRFRLKYGTDNPKQVRELFARKDIAERIVVAFEEVLSWARKDIRTELPLAHVVKTIDLSRRRITDEEYQREVRQLEELNRAEFAAQGTPQERLVHDSTLVARRNRCKRILERYEEQKTQPKLQMELHVIRIGDVAFASNTFELYMDYMHRIQARSPFVQTFVVQLAGTPTACSGYLATERGVWGRGYSASLYCNQVSPEGGQELVEQTLEVLKELQAVPE